LDATLRYAVQLEMMIKTLIDVLTRSLFAHVGFYENIFCVPMNIGFLGSKRLTF